MPETQWMTLLETADIMKRLPIQVTRMCEDGKLEYYMEEGRYFVSRESIDLFMHPRTGGPAPSDRGANGTPRRRYGRAPDDVEPSTESAAEAETANGRDEADAAGVTETGGIVEEATGTVENAEAQDDAVVPEIDDIAPVEAEAQDDDEIPETAVPVDVEAQEDGAMPPPETDDSATVKAEAQDDGQEPQAAAHLEEGGPVEQDDDATRTDETLLRHSGDGVSPVREEDQAASMTNPAEPDARAMEILADLRAAITRHAMEHKAFCDEIAGLADALESTLSRDEDKTSELTREISSLLARYSRR